MKNKLFKIVPAFLLATVMASSLLSVVACGGPALPPGGQIDGLTDKPLEGEMLADFGEGKSSRFFESDGWGNGSVFNTYWKANHVSYADDVMKLTIGQPEEPYEIPVYDKDGNQTGVTVYEYEGGEARSYAHYGYGDYQVSMKPSNKAGTASTFFICTGDYDVNPNTGEKNPWDEIDIEFLGQDTTKVQFNYYINGVGGHEYMYDLGFDASEEFHTYGFRWAEDYITWFVDGEPVFKINGSEDVPIPSAAGRILMNYWCGTEEAEGWMGEYSDPGDEGPVYQWVKTSAAQDWTDANDPNLPKEPIDKYEGEWGEAITPDFVSSTEGLYTVTNDGTSANVTYENLTPDWQNVSTDITEAAADKNWVTLKLKNNGETTPRIRINVVNKADPEKAVVLNDYGYCGDDELEKVDGHFVEVAPDETKEVVIRYNGTAHSLELMIDSANTTGGPYAGDITVSEIKFGREGEIVELPDPPSPVTINGQQVEIVGGISSNGGKYDVSNIQNGINVKYEGVTGKDYSNVELKTEAIAPSNNTLTLKITNNGAAAVNVRVNIQANIASSANTNACNLSATMNGSEVYTDKDWGGSMFDAIQPGATVEVVVKYDASKQPTTVQFMIDSHKGDEAAHSGDIDITDIAFSNDGTTPEEPGEPDTPVNPPAAANEITIDGQKVAFNSDTYTVAADAEANSLNITYANVPGNGYKVVSAGGLAAITAGKNQLTFTVKNNGSATVKMRIDVLDANNANLVAGIEAAGGSVTGFNNGEAVIEIAAGATETVTVTFSGAAATVNFFLDSCTYDDTTTHSGNITLSAIAFSSKAQ